MRAWLCALALIAAAATEHGNAQGVTFGGLRTRTAVTPSELTITSNDPLPTAIEDDAYAGVTLQRSGGTGPFTWGNNDAGTSLNDGDAHCAGLVISSAGAISGTPTANGGGTCTFTADVEDSLSATDTQTLNIVVQAAASPELPANWSMATIGTGSACVGDHDDTDMDTDLDAGESIEVTGGAGSIFSTSDSFCFATFTLTGDKEIIVEVDSNDDVSGSAFGVMVRKSLNADASNIFAGTNRLGQPYVQYRLTDGAVTSSSGTIAAEHRWRRITVIGDLVTGYWSDDGTSWTQQGTSQTIDLNATYFVGLAVAAGSGTAAAVFDNISTATITSEEADDFGGYRPHFQGFGTSTRGGAGGSTVERIYVVNTTADNADAPVLQATVGGVGIYTSSLRAALVPSSCTPRFVLMGTSGTVMLTSRITVTCDNLTIAAQTAPSPGFMGAVYQLRIEASDVVIQHLRWRVGDSVTTTSQIGVFARDNVVNLVCDHCSFSWGTDETFSFNAGSGPEPQDISVLDSIISETLDTPDGGVANHSRAVSTGPAVNGTITFARSLFAHNDVRNPSIRAGWRSVMLNNAIYNYKGTVGGTNHGGTTYSCFSGETPPIEAVHIGNIAVTGPETPASHKTIKFTGGTSVCPGSQVYLEDNTGFGITTSTGNGQWSGVELSGTTELSIRTDTRPTWYTTFNFAELASDDVESYITDNAGARPLDRDAHDTRIISEFGARTGSIKDSLDTPGEVPPSTEVTAGNVKTLTANSNSAALLTALQALTDPDSDGDCGTMADGFVRTELMCFLESDATYGAQRLEMYQGVP